MTPLGDRVALRIVPTPPRAGNIFLPADSTAPERAAVVAVGAEATEVAVGDTVIIPRGAGLDCEVDGLRVVHAEVILAKVMRHGPKAGK